MIDEWATGPLAEFAEVSRHRTDPRLLGDQPLVHYSIPVLDETGLPAVEVATTIASHKFTVTRDAVLVSLLNPRIPRVWKAIGAPNAVCSTEFAVLTPVAAGLETDFLHLLCQSEAFWEELQKRAVGTTGSRQRAKAEGLLSIIVAIPPVAVQRRIVDLMAHLDNHIANLRAEFAHLKEARNAALAVALDGGLSIAASDDAWLERPLGELADFINGYPFKPADLKGTRLPVIRIKQLLDPEAEVDFTDVQVPEKVRLVDGDLVFSWSGSLASRIWDRGPAALNQHLFRVVESAGVLRTWLHLVLDHAVDELMTKTHGTTMKHVTKGVLENHVVRMPPTADQERIVKFVGAFDEILLALNSEMQTAEHSREVLLQGLLSGHLSIENRYDHFLSEVA